MTSFFRRPPNMSYDDYVEFIARADAELRRILTFFPDTSPDDPPTLDRSEPLNMREDPGLDPADLDGVMMTPDEVRALNEKKDGAPSGAKPPSKASEPPEKK